MKSLVSILHAVVESLLADATLAYPTMGREFSVDKQKLAVHLIDRGLGFFTLDLPSLENCLTAGLESGRLSLEGPFSRKVSKRIHVPAFLRGLWLRIFDKDGALRQDPDTTAILFLRQILLVGKKVTLTCTPARNEKAIKEFVDVENALRRPSLSWDSDVLRDGADSHRISFSGLYDDSARTAAHSCQGELFADSLDQLRPADSRLLRRLDKICRDLSVGFGLFDPVAYENELLEKGRPCGTKHGPGAVSDRKSDAEKYPFPCWPDKLDLLFPYDMFGCTSLTSPGTFVNMEHPSKLHLVPKTAKTPRLIASEPSYHQWCQQLVKTFLEEKTNEIVGVDFIDYRSQARAHPLVQRSSQDGSLATVDLSAASDRLSCFVIERAWAGNLSLLDAFHACRTRVISRSQTADIEPLFLKKFSTMGSALTFPLQTLFFLAACLAVLPGRPRLKDQLDRYRGRVRVFGDDIIIPSHGYVDLVRLLTILGLKVNESKSFVNGRFRESCGFDAYRGDDVTPVKPQLLDPTTPAGRQSLIDLSNNLFVKGFWTASRTVTSLLPRDTFRYLPVVGPREGSVGLISFCGRSTDHLRKRVNPHLHRPEVLAISYESKCETTESVGTDYTFQSLHNLARRGQGLEWRNRLFPSGSSALGRIVKSVTRERRRWVVDTLETVC